MCSSTYILKKEQDDLIINCKLIIMFVTFARNCWSRVCKWVFIDSNSIDYAYFFDISGILCEWELKPWLVYWSMLHSIVTSAQEYPIDVINSCYLRYFLRLNSKLQNPQNRAAYRCQDIFIWINTPLPISGRCLHGRL